MRSASVGHRPASSEDTRGRPQVRVMVVDDNPDFRESLLALLATTDLMVVGEAGGGQEALEIVGQAEPDVVLMDVRMPGMDGLETTRRLKALRPSVRVVALTAQEDHAVVREMLLAGASGYVLKSSRGEDILEAVAQAARGRALLSPGVTPTVIQELTAALERERQRARELEEAHVALVQRAARRHELVARLGHELRTPVTVILGVARTLAEGKAEPAQRSELLELLARRALALARLVERFEVVLDGAAAERLDPVALAREILAGRERVRVSADGEVPSATADRTLARRILEELVDNACRFSRPETLVEVRIRRAGQRIEVRVADRGPGIPPADRDRIFEPLEQAEELHVRMHPGAGMGLPLSRAAARAMDGDLVLEASGPTGSTFLWTLPVAQS